MKTRYTVGSLVLLIIFLGLGVFLLSGFDKSRHIVALNEIVSGGPPKDGIPAILFPDFVKGAQANRFMLPDDRILGLTLNNQAKAYPIKILNWHEIVNDKIGGQAVVVTYCPLCGTGMVFNPKVEDKILTFGVSGLLYQSDMLLYDHQTESLWSQIKSQAVTGDLIGTMLQLLPSVQTTWKEWLEKYPETRVLSTNTGYTRNYERDPYQGYYKSRELYFGVNRKSDLFHPKERIIGIQMGSRAKAYPFSELAKVNSPVQDKIGNRKIVVSFDRGSQTASIHDTKGNELPAVVGFWFAWFAFHPETEIYKGKI